MSHAYQGTIFQMVCACGETVGWQHCSTLYVKQFGIIVQTLCKFYTSDTTSRTIGKKNPKKLSSQAVVWYEEAGPGSSQLVASDQPN